MAVLPHARGLVRSIAVAAVVAAAVVATSDTAVSGTGFPGGAPLLRVPVLMYHLIVPVAEAHGAAPELVVPPEEFAAQMDALRTAGWHSITAARLASYLEARETPPARTFVVTIDDGYDDGYTYASPILRENGFVASYYVVAGRIGHSHNLNVGQLQALAAAGNEIGNHSMTHRHLSGLGGDELAGEICAASDAIEAITTRRPATFAYPFGDRDRNVAAAVLSCRGLLMALSTRLGSSETWAGRFDVPRIAVEPHTRPADLLDLMGRGA